MADALVARRARSTVCTARVHVECSAIEMRLRGDAAVRGMGARPVVAVIHVVVVVVVSEPKVHRCCLAFFGGRYTLTGSTGLDHFVWYVHLTVSAQ